MNNDGVSVVNMPDCVINSPYSGELKVLRFGYLDGDSNFSLVYETGESDDVLYPGIAITLKSQL